MTPLVLFAPAEYRPQYIERILNHEKCVLIVGEDQLLQLLEIEVVGNGHQDVLLPAAVSPFGLYERCLPAALQQCFGDLALAPLMINVILR